jgi:hypothetical protein
VIFFLSSFLISTKMSAAWIVSTKWMPHHLDGLLLYYIQIYVF